LFGFDVGHGAAVQRLLEVDVGWTVDVLAIVVQIVFVVAHDHPHENRVLVLLDDHLADSFANPEGHAQLQPAWLALAKAETHARA
jgi:hypothetical protein